MSKQNVDALTVSVLRHAIYTTTAPLGCNEISPDGLTSILFSVFTNPALHISTFLSVLFSLLTESLLAEAVF